MLTVSTDLETPLPGTEKETHLQMEISFISVLRNKNSTKEIERSNWLYCTIMNGAVSHLVNREALQEIKNGGFL